MAGLVTGCWNYEISDEPYFACHDETVGYEAQVGGCQLSRECAWIRPLAFENEEYTFVGSVVCFGDEGGMQTCTCAEVAEYETVVHSFDFEDACSAAHHQVEEIAALCGWPLEPSMEDGIVEGIDVHEGDERWAVAIESASVTSARLGDDSQSWDPGPGGGLPDVFIAGTSDDALTGDWETDVVRNTLRPVWSETVASYWAFDLVRDGLRLSVYDEDPVVDDLIDRCHIEVTRQDLEQGGLTAECSHAVMELVVTFTKESDLLEGS